VNNDKPIAKCSQFLKKRELTFAAEFRMIECWKEFSHGWKKRYVSGGMVRHWMHPCPLIHQPINDCFINGWITLNLADWHRVSHPLIAGCQLQATLPSEDGIICQ
jgi:hypothetical protein